AHSYRHVSRLSAAFAFLADISMMAMGGALKRKEKISGRLGDILSMMYLASATLKRYEDQGRLRDDLPLVRWSVRDALYRAQLAFDQILSNFPSKTLATLLRMALFPRGMPFRPPLDSRNHECARIALEPGSARDRLTAGKFAASDLATQAGRTLLARQKFAPDELDEVILGCAAPSVDEVNIGRVAALRMGCGQQVPGWTVMRNCASGMQAVDSGISNILAGRSELVLAGGVDALSRATLLYGDKMVLWFSEMAVSKTAFQKTALFAKLPVKALLAPVIGIMKGLTDPMVGLLMGQTAENVAQRFGITREQMDAFSVRSHSRAARAQEEGRLAPGGGEVEALYGADGATFPLDDGVRRDSSMENLAK